jgi:hypothetical protein
VARLIQRDEEGDGDTEGAEEYEKQTVGQLRAELQNRGLGTMGSKKDLVASLREDDEDIDDEEEAAEEEEAMEYEKRTVDQLRAELKGRMLSAGGAKSQLVARLYEDDKDGSDEEGTAPTDEDGPPEAAAAAAAAAPQGPRGPARPGNGKGSAHEGRSGRTAEAQGLFEALDGVGDSDDPDGGGGHGGGVPARGTARLPRAWCQQGWTMRLEAGGTRWRSTTLP